LDCWINETVLQNMHIQEESDGVLHKTTQQFRSALTDDPIFEARGANHEELLNHPALRKCIMTEFGTNKTYIVNLDDATTKMKTAYTPFYGCMRDVVGGWWRWLTPCG
jgi:hypothetical protein